jgi:hypothetical protein
MSIVAEGTRLAGELDATYPPVLNDWQAKRRQSFAPLRELSSSEGRWQQ